MNLSNDTINRKMSIMRASKIENIPYEEQAKFVNDRLMATEESLAKISAAVSSYVTKLSRIESPNQLVSQLRSRLHTISLVVRLAHGCLIVRTGELIRGILRDATDNLAFVLHEYASEEKVNRSSKGHILQCSELLASVGDYRDIEVKQLGVQILKEMCNYQMLCVNAKTKVKNILNLKEKEINKRKQLQKLKNRNPYNRERIIKAEASLSVAVASISSSLKELEQHIRLFEEKKLRDMKSLLMKFMTIEIAYHSGAIQLYTDSFKEINKIDVVSDLHDFEEIMKKNISDEHLSNKTFNPVKDVSQLLGNSHNNMNKDTIRHESHPNCTMQYRQQLTEKIILSDTDFSTTNSL